MAPNTDGSQAQNSNVSFTYTKTWDKSAGNHGTRPSQVHFALFRTYEGAPTNYAGYVKSIDKQVKGDTVGETITPDGSDEALPSGVWVDVDGIGQVWKPYSYYLKEYESTYNNSNPPTAINYNNSYKSEYIYEPDKPFILQSNNLYADLNQGLENKLQKTKHEVIKAWYDNDNEAQANGSTTYTIQLQSKTSSDSEWHEVDLSKIIVTSVKENDEIKSFERVTGISARQTTRKSIFKI